MPELNIVMVEPEIPQNTGNIARSCAATGARLHLVKPLGFDISERAVRRAGLDYWSLVDITVYDGIDDFFEKTNGPYYYFSTKARHIHSEVKFPDGAYLLFGKETKGLPEQLLHENPDTTVRIPMISDARSLNLSNAVAIGLYEVLRQWGYPQLKCKGEPTSFEWE